jgi:GNAT superfamily N-acetyltransferase
MRFGFPSAEALGIAFRPCRDEDLPFLADLYASTRAEEVATTGWPAEAQREFLDQQFAAQHRHYRLHYPDADWVLIARDGAPVGRVYIAERDNMLRLIDIALLPASRGGGVGTAILTDLLRQAEALGLGIVIHVERYNPARRLYDRLGFAFAADTGVYDRMEWRPAAPDRHSPSTPPGAGTAAQDAG